MVNDGRLAPSFGLNPASSAGTFHQTPARSRISHAGFQHIASVDRMGIAWWVSCALGQALFKNRNPRRDYCVIALVIASQYLGDDAADNRDNT